MLRIMETRFVLVTVAMPVVVIVSMLMVVTVFVIVRVLMPVVVFMTVVMGVVMLVTVLVMLMFAALIVLMFVFVFFAHGFAFPSLKFDFSSRIGITDKARQARNVPAALKSFTRPSYPIRPVPFKINVSATDSLESPVCISTSERGRDRIEET
jgi:hypothetical protein